MKPRDFRFKALLKYKAFIEDEMKQEFANVSERLDIEEKRLFALEEIWRQAIVGLEERQIKETPLHEIFMYHTYLQQLSLEMEGQRKRVLEAQKIYHEKREFLITASQERKIVEKVREKDAEGRVGQNNREDKKSMDETANNRYVRENC